MADTVELNTLGAVIKTTYESQSDTNAFTDVEKLKLANMSDTAFSGAYADLTGKPALFSGAWGDLTGRPDYIAAGATRSAVLSDIGAIPVAQKGAANGVAPLDSAGLVPLVHLNVGGLSFKGAWNPVSNTPNLIDGTGSVGDFYKADRAGTFNFGNGDFNFLTGDWVIYAGGTWQRIGTSDAVAMVNGKIGNVSLTAADVGALPTSYTAPVLSVNGKSGAVTLNADEVGALPSTYIPPAPTWASVSGKPDFPALYQAKQRGSIGPAIPAALMYLTANHNLATNVYDYVPFSGVEYDQFSMRTNASTFTVPAWAKYARVTGQLRFASNVNGGRQAGVRKNNVDVIGGGYDIAIAAGVGSEARRISTGIIPVVGGDTLRVVAFQSSGGVLAIEAGTSQQHSWVQIELYE